MKKLLSLDLGVTTGWAVMDTKERLLAHGVILPDSNYAQSLKDILLQYMPTHSVAERPVIFRGPLGAQLEIIVHDTQIVLDHQVKFISPSDWKDSRFKKHPVPRGITQHERDAIRIGVWYMNTELIGL